MVLCRLNNNVTETEAAIPRDELLGQAGCGSARRLVHRLLAGMVSLVLPLALGGSVWGADKAPPAFRNDRILVKPKPAADISALHAATTGQVLYSFKGIGGLQIVKLPAGANPKDIVAQYQASGQVEYAELDFEVHIVDMPNDTYFADGSMWAMYNYGQNGGTAGADISAVQGWDIRNAAPNVVVAVVDTGIRYTHQELAANMWTDHANPSSHGINALTGTNDPMDDHGHGSHVSGTIGAVGNNGKGVVGVARQVKLMGCKFLDSSGSGTTSGAITCIDYARTHGANIMSNSWGGGGFSQALMDSITAAANAGILFVVAAGNSSSNNDTTPTYPASYNCPNIVAVACTNRNDGLSSFSNYGPTTVHLGAPGEAIISCWNTSDLAYNTISGTSMATPHVSGALALLTAQFPGMTYQQLKSNLLTAVDPIPALAGKCVSGGRLNLLKALDLTTPTVTVNQASGQSDPTNLSPINFTVVFSEPVVDFTAGKVTLSGTAGAATVAISGSAATYTVAVSGMSSNGTVSASIPSGVVHNRGGLGNAASTSTDNTVTYVLPGSLVWNGGSATSDNWSDDANWSGAHLNPAGQLIFQGTTRLTPFNDTAPGTVYSWIRFDTGGFTLGGNGLALHSFTGINSMAGMNTVSLPLTLDIPLTFTAASGSTLVLDSNGMVDNAGNLLTVDTSGTCRFNGVISGAGGLAKSGGAGDLFLGAPNTYGGPTGVSSGALRLGAAGAVPAGNNLTIGTGATVDVSDGANTFALSLSELNGAGSLTNSAVGTAALTVNTANTDTFSGIISGTLSLEKQGPGTLILAGANSYAGTTTVSGGALRVQHASALGNTIAGVTVSSGAALEIQGGIVVGATPLVLNGTGIGGAGALHSLSGANSMSGAIALNSNATVAVDAAQLTLSGTISGASSLTKTGAGSLTLAADNTYSGATTVNAGTLWVNGSQPSSPVSVKAAATLGGTGTVGAITCTGGTVSPGTATVGGQLVTNGGFESGGFTGWTTAVAGTPFIPWTVSAGGAGGGYNPPYVTAPVAGTYDAWNGFEGAGPMQYTMYQDVAVPASGATLSWQERIQWNMADFGGSTLPRTYSVQVQDPGTGNVLATLFTFSAPPGTKNDTGWVSHSADLSAYAGTTVRLFFVEDIPEYATGPGQIEFDALAATANTPGGDILTANGNTTLDAGSTFSVLLNGVDAGTGYSQLKASGAVDLGGCTLNETLGFTPAAGTQFTIIENDGGGPVGSTFKGLPEGATIGIGRIALQVSYRGGAGGNSVVLTSAVTPPPVISSAPMANGIAGTAFSYQITASNSPASYSATPLPAGLSVKAGTGAITGTPTTVGTTSVTISATNAGGTGSATLTITVNTGLTITTLAGLAGSSGSTDGTGSAARFYHPYGVAADASGNLYVADSYNHTIRRITSTGAVSTLAGSAGNPGSTDGTGGNARFNGPNGVAVDSSGNVYVADSSNHTIRMITPAGVVTTLAGLAGSSGSADGTGSGARFYLPYGVAVDGSGNVYVADSSNHTIRMITPAGVVSTLAGLAGSFGSTDGTGSGARFYDPNSLAVDSTGNIYVADSNNNTIRALTSAGVVSTVAGLAGFFGIVDGTGSAARFHYPCGVAVDGSGNLLVADTGNHTIRRINSAACVSTPAGLAGIVGTADGTASAARFYEPSGVAVDSSGSVCVGDNYNHTIRRSLGRPAITSSTTANGTLGVPFSYTITATNSPTSYNAAPLPAGLSVNTSTGVISGTPTAVGTTNVTISATNGTGTGTATATLTITLTLLPPVITSSSTASGYVGIAFSYNITATNIPTSYSATGLPSWASVKTGTGAITGTPTTVGTTSVTISATNSVGTGSAILTITINSVLRITTLAGLAGSSGSTDGTGSAARLCYPMGVAVDGAGTAYVADTNNHTIRKVTSAGVLSTLAGLAGSSGSADGTGSVARFDGPEGVAVDGSGNVYVGDTLNNTIRKVTPAGVVSTLAGLAGPAGSTDGTGGAARFYYPRGVAVDGSGNVYVADSANYTIRKITPEGVVSTLAGLAGSSGSTDGTGNAARFYNPFGVSVGGSGDLYVADTYNYTIRKVTPAGLVSTVAGSAGSAGSADGTGSAARFNTPYAVAADNADNVYVADSSNHTIRRVTSARAVSTVAGLAGTSGSADGTGSGARFYFPYGVAVDSSGDVCVADTVNYTIRRSAGPPLITSPATANGTAGQVFSYSITATNNPTSFSASGLPAWASVNTSTGAITGSATTAGTTSATISATNTAGTGSGPLTITIAPGPTSSLVVTGFPSPAMAGNAGNVTVTAKDAYGNTATGYTGNIHFSSSDTSSGLPADYTFVSGDNGTHSFSATLKTAGTQSITATDTSTGSINGTQSGIGVNPAGAAKLAFATQPSGGTGGTVFGTQPVAAVQDSYGNIVTSASNSITLSIGTNPSSGTLSATTNPLAASSGVASFAGVKIDKTGNGYTLTASASGLTSATSSAFNITLGPALTLAVTGYPSRVTAGTSGNVTVTAQDAGANTATGYTGTLRFTSSDAQAVLPADYIFVSGDNGSHGFSVTLMTVGTQSITATDTATSSITGTQPGITVNPPAPVISTVTTATGAVGQAFSYRITASNSPTSYSATGLPAWWSINESTGVISGIPTTAGTISATISATNAGGTGSETLTITANPAPHGVLDVFVWVTLRTSVHIVWGDGTTGKTAGDVTALDWTVQDVPPDAPVGRGQVGRGKTCVSNDDNNRVAMNLENTSNTGTKARVSAAVTGDGGWNIAAFPEMDTFVIQAQLAGNSLATLTPAAQELTDTIRLAKGADQALVLTVMTPTDITRDTGVGKTMFVTLTATAE